jgi:hypothetical protein
LEMHRAKYALHRQKKEVQLCFMVNLNAVWCAILILRAMYCQKPRSHVPLLGRMAVVAAAQQHKYLNV